MTQVVILAAGKGKRMGGEKPKVLCEVGGKSIIMRLVESVLASDVTSRPLVVIGYGTEIIKKYLGTKCSYVLQPEQLGTAHAVFCTKDFLEGQAENILVLYGDHPFIKSKTISNLELWHKKSGATITMMTVKLPNFDGWYKIFEDFGRVVRDKDGKVKAIVEKKDAAEDEVAIKEVNPSFFIFKSSWLWENLPKLNCNNAQGEYYLTDLVRLAILNNLKVETLTIDDPFEAVGINNPEQLALAQSLAQAK